VTTIESNKRIACEWLALVSEHRLDDLCALTPATWVMHGGPPNLPAGPEGLRILFGTFGEIKQTWTIEDVIAEGNKVVVRATNRCLQESFFGIPSHGRWQSFSSTFTFRVEDGRVQEIWRNADDLGRVLQLGAQLLPAKAEDVQ
jgi:hypothetical protein